MFLLKVGAKVLDNALRDLPGAEFELGPPEDDRVEVLISVSGRRYRLTLVGAGQGWPSEVKTAIGAIRQPWPRHLAMVARKLSPGSLEILRQADANWLDEAGNVRLSVPPGLAILREAPRDAAVKGASGFHWSPSSIEIAEFILYEDDDELRTGELAERTEWSSGQVSQVLAAFEDQGWTERRGGRSGRSTWFELVKPGALLDAWADMVSRASYKKRLGHTTHRDLLRFAHMMLETALGKGRSDWALTTWAGLQIITPYATTTPVLHVYVEAQRFARELDEVMQAAQVREVEEGARVEFWEADFKLRTQLGRPHELPVASNPRVYADLLGLGGRASDAAQHLRETAIGY